jgi:hypothetical protein
MIMFATDFIFDENRLSDFDCIIGSFNGSDSTATGGEIEFTVVKAPSNDKFDFYGSQFNTVLEWEFSIIKNPCRNSHEEMYFNQYEESELSRWLLRQDGYKYIHFIQDGFEDVYYKVQINMTPHQISGHTIGYDLTVTSDCGYGYSEEIVKESSIKKDTSYEFDVYGDVSSYILPTITISNGSGSFYLSNANDTLQNYSNGKQTSFDNVIKEITMDSENDIISGIVSPDDFSWYFLRLLVGTNTISTDSENEINLKITYREPRRVIV